VAYLGFSAETGELSDNHDLVTVSTKNLYDTKGRDGTTRPTGTADRKKAKYTKNKQKEGSSWSWFFFKIILFFMVVGGAYVGYTAWRTQQRRSHRF